MSLVGTSTGAAPPKGGGWVVPEEPPPPYGLVAHQPGAAAAATTGAAAGHLSKAEAGASPVYYAATTTVALGGISGFRQATLAQKACCMVFLLPFFIIFGVVIYGAVMAINSFNSVHEHVFFTG